MPSYPTNHTTKIAHLLTAPSSKRMRRQGRTPVLVTEAPVSQFNSASLLGSKTMQGSPKKNHILSRDWSRMSDSKAGRLDKWGEVVARHDSQADNKPLVTRSTEVHAPIVRSFTGGKATIASRHDGEAMAAKVTSAYNRLHHGSC